MATLKSLNIKTEKLSEPISNIINDMLDESWLKKTISQVASIYLNDAHALSNTPEWAVLKSVFAENNLDIYDYLIRTDILYTSIVSFNWFNPIMANNGPVIITPTDLDNINNVKNIPDEVIVIENDNLAYSLAPHTKKVLILGSGQKVASPNHLLLLKWLSYNGSKISYIGDLDPVGLNITDNILSKLNIDESIFLKYYPEPQYFLKLLMTKGIKTQNKANKRFKLKNIESKKLYKLGLMFQTDSFNHYIEQEQLLNDYIKQLN